jgi:hypothetical protein
MCSSQHGVPDKPQFSPVAAAHPISLPWLNHAEPSHAGLPARSVISFGPIGCLSVPCALAVAVAHAKKMVVEVNFILVFVFDLICFLLFSVLVLYYFIL